MLGALAETLHCLPLRASAKSARLGCGLQHSLCAAGACLAAAMLPTPPSLRLPLRAFEMVSAGLHCSFRMSRQMLPWLLMLGWYTCGAWYGMGRSGNDGWGMPLPGMEGTSFNVCVGADSTASTVRQAGSSTTRPKAAHSAHRGFASQHAMLYSHLDNSTGNMQQGLAIVWNCALGALRVGC